MTRPVSCGTLLLTALLTLAQPSTAIQSPGPTAEPNLHPAAGTEPATALFPATSPSPGPEIYDRLLALLQAIPRRWDTLPAPVVPPSGRSIEQILHSAPAAQDKAALDWILRLRSVPPGERPALIRSELERRSFNEVDLWRPGTLAQSQQGTSREEEALTIEAWLQWAEALGRKDALKLAASFAMEILKIHLGGSAILELISAWTALPSPPSADRSQANLLEHLADSFTSMGQQDKALQTYRECRRIFAAIGSELGQGNCSVREGEVLLLQGANDQALDAVQKARQHFQATGAQLGQGQTWNDEGDILLRLDRSREALDAYRKARQLYLAAGDQLGQANSWLGEGEVLRGLGEDQMALAAYRAGRELFIAAGDQLGEGNTWKGEADILFHLDRLQEALGAVRKARQLLAAVEDLLGQGNTWIREGEIFFFQGNDQDSLRAYRNSRQNFAAGGDPLGQANSWLGEARVSLRMHAFREAATAADTALARYQSTGVAQGEINSLIVKAQAAAGTGDALSAANWATAAIRLHAQWRKTSLTEVQRTAQEDAISVAYDILVPLRAGEAGREAEALRLAEESRSRVLLDLMITAPNGAGRATGGGELTADRHRLETELWTLEDRLHRSATREQELRLQRFQIDQELEWNRHQVILAQQSSLAVAPPLDAPAIQALARKTGPLLFYYTAESRILGFLVLPAPAPIIVRSIDLSRDELAQQVRALAHDLANPLFEQRSSAPARRLWDLLIAPFSGHIPAPGPLVIMPHGPLHELPFEALLDPEGKPLFERWQTSVAPSASALEFARRRHKAPSPADPFLIFASGQGLSGPEATEIAALLGADRATFRPTEALYPNYERFAAQARNLFIATRGTYGEDSRGETYLEIQPTPEVHDSRLTASEIATIPLQAELVTLAACDTSHGHALLSDERLDLTRSFLMAGAAAVLATRWKIPEDSTATRFLIDFFHAYRHGAGKEPGLRKDQALTEARRCSRQRGDPAQVWAAWVLVGDAT